MTLQSGFRLFSAEQLNAEYAPSALTTTGQNALTALAAGGQTGATQLGTGLNRVTTVASAADSVLLPVSKAGATCVVINAAAANSMTVYPQVGDTINALTANTGLAVAAGKTITFYCPIAGKWFGNLSA